MNRNKYNRRRTRLQKITAFVIATVMLLFSVSEVFAANNNNGGFELKMSWTGSSDANYKWDTSVSETKTIRMLVSYSNKAPERKYEPGELVITVPGIGKANRGQTMQATDVAADKAGSPIKTKNWSYTYNSRTDTYTFVNNVAVNEGSPFIGSFELLWTMASRDTVDGFNKTIEATLQTSDNIRVTSGSIKYSQKRTPDEYKITQSPTALYSAQGVNGTLKIEDYYWVGFPITGNRQKKSLAIKNSRYKITVPSGAIVTYAMNTIDNTPLSIEQDGNAYIINQNAGVNEIRYSSGSVWTYIYVAYPKDRYSADSIITNKLELEATYNDHDGERKTIAETVSTLRMGDYEFNHYSGSLYTFSERAFGPRTFFDFHPGTQSFDENKECYNDGFLNATDLASGKGSARFSLGGSIHRASAENAYTMEYGIDFMDVLLNSGNFRQLGRGEYEYTFLEIPSTSRFRNDNGIPVQSGAYGVDVYAVTLANPEVKILVASTSILDSGQKIALPDGTYSVSFKIKSLKENVNFENYRSAVSPFTVIAKFHLNSDAGLALGDRVKTDQGRVINTSYFKIYDKNDAWINNNFNAGDYDNSTNIHIAQRDIDTYGTYLERERDFLHVHEITSLYYGSVFLENMGRDSQGFNLKTTLRTNFKYSGDGELKNFTMATVLPDGVRLPYSQIDVSDFLASLSISGISGITSAEAISRVSATIDKDYKGSGRVYVRLDFDLTGLGITQPNMISADFPTFVNDEDFKRCGANYNIQSTSSIGDTDYVTRAQYNGSEDNGSYDADSALWNDINQNGNSNDPLSYARGYLTIVAAEETHLLSAKSVATDYTNGQYFSGVNNDVPNVSYDGSYEYKLKLSTEKNSKAKNIVFVDNLETGDNAEWKGEFVGVDVSYATEMGFTPTVYYSTDPNQSKDLTSNGWSTGLPSDPSSVKSIAVDLGSAFLSDNSFVYVIVKMNAPSLDQNLKNKITENKFAIDFTSVGVVVGNEEHKSLESNLCRTKLIEPFGRAVLIKTDDKDVVLPDVKFELFDKDSNIIKSDLITNSAGQIVVDNLPYGDYYFVEKEPTAGYEFSSAPVYVTVNSRTVQVNVVNQRKPGQISLIKKNSQNLQLYVQGAVFSLFKKDGTLVKKDMVTNQEGKLDKTMYPELGNLEWGSYYFQETSAPSGYMLDTTPIEFKIDAESAENAQGKILEAKNNQEVGGNVQFTKYEILEDGVTKTTNPVSSAVYDLHFKDSGTWKSIGTYITDSNGEIYISGLTFGDYYLKEKSAPQGYRLNTDEVHFTVNGTHILDNFQTAVSYDIRKHGSINLHKTGDSKEEVKGSVFGLFDLNDNLIQKGTTSAEGVIDFKNIVWGEYYLQEISAPQGYQLNTNKYPVTVGRENVDKTIIQGVINNQVKGKVRLTKMAEADHSIKLSGAVYSLYKTDGTRVGNYRTDAQGEIYVENLSWGSYYFEEVSPPSGYGLSSDKIRFSVNATSSLSVQELEAFDPVLSAQLVIEKRIKKESIVFDHGVPYFTFKLEGTDINNIPHTYYKTVSFTKEYIDSIAVDADGFISASVVFSQLASGNYTASEEPVIRYSQSRVILGLNAVSGSDGTVVFDLTNGKLEGTATFVNEKPVQGGTSHTSFVNNVIRKSKVITGISANYKGTETITTSKLDRSELDVFAIYDDGSQDKLADNEYTLDPENFEGMEPGNYTVTVSYNGGGATKKATFQVGIDPPIPFTWVIDKTTNEASITGYTGNSSVVRFPSTVKENGVTYPVTGLLKNVSTLNKTPISGLKNAAGIIIPEGIEVIGNGAFYKLSNLTGELKLPTTLKKIQSSAFVETGFTSKLNLPEGITAIGGSAFAKCNGFTGDLVIPNSVEEIEAYAFDNCAGFNGTLTLPNNLKLIDVGVFQHAGFTGKLIIPDGVERIENSAFKGTGFTGELQIPFGVKEIKNSAFYNCCGLSGHLTIPDSVTFVGQDAFSTDFSNNHIKFTGLTLSRNLKTIEKSAFAHLGTATGPLVIPDSVEFLGEYAFSYGGFTSLKLPDVPKFTEILRNTFYSMDKAQGTLVIPEGITSIGNTAFRSSSSYTSLVLPSTLKTIGDAAFYSLNKPTALALPENLVSIGKEAFAYCTGFTGDLTLPDSLVSIGISAFQNCFNMNGTLQFPNNANFTTIPDSAFKSTGFNSVIMSDYITTVGNNAFYNGYLSNRNLTKNIVLSKNLTSIGEYAFYYLSSVEGTVRVPSTIDPTKIGANAFTKFGKQGSCTVELPRACSGSENTYGNPWTATVSFYD